MTVLSLFQTTTYHWTLEEDLVACHRHGFEGIGLWRPKLTDVGVDAAVEILHDAGVPVTSLSWVGGFTGMDGTSYRDAVEDAKEGLSLAAALGSPRVVLYPGARGNHIGRHVHRILRAALEELSPLAASLGTTLVLLTAGEPWGQDRTFLFTPAEYDDVLADWPDLALGLDLFHVAADRFWLAALPDLAGRTALVRWADTEKPTGPEPDRLVPGRGDSACRRTLATLMAAGYTGPVELDVLGRSASGRDYDDILAEAVTVWRDTVG